MKSLNSKIPDTLAANEEGTMGLRKIMAPQDAQKDELWNSTYDRWSRKAKHPLQKSEAMTMNEKYWEKGDTVTYKGINTTVQIPHGPNGTVGILYEGKLKMVLSDNLSEAVMGGMQPLNPINRMMQLAGLSVTQVIEPSNDTEQDDQNLKESEKLEEADATGMFQQLMKANFSGEYRNNPGAARLATIGQILLGLNTIVAEMKAKNEIPADVGPKLESAVGLGGYLLQSAQQMLKP